MIKFLITYFFLLTPIIIISNSSFAFGKYLFLILSIIFLLKNGLNKTNLKNLIPCFILFIFSLLNYMFFGFNDNFLLLKSINVILLLFASAQIVSLHNYNKEKLFSSIFHVFIINGILAFLMLNPVFYDFISNYFYLNININLKEEMSLFRPFGITSSGGATLSISYAFFAYLIIKDSIKVKKNITNRDYFRVIFILLFSLFFARTGIVLFILLISINLKNLFKLIKFITVFCLLYIFGYWLYISFPPENQLYDYLISRAFEPLINYNNYGLFATSSSNKLTEMFFIPETNFLYGNGIFSRSNVKNILVSDPGFIRLYYGSGILGLLVISLASFYFFSKSFDDTKKKYLIALILVLLSTKEYLFIGISVFTQLIFLNFPSNYERRNI